MSSHAVEDFNMEEAIAREYFALADLLESGSSDVWDAPSLCEGWRTREVVAHVTMPARYSGPQFMAEMQAAGGDFTVFSNTVADRDCSLPEEVLLKNLRAEALHTWQPPGGGLEGALSHCVIHSLDITEAIPLGRQTPEPTVRAVLDQLAGLGVTNPFGVDVSGFRLQADDMDWSVGAGEVVAGPGRALVCVLSGRHLPDDRLQGDGAVRFRAR